MEWIETDWAHLRVMRRSWRESDHHRSDSIIHFLFRDRIVVRRFIRPRISIRLRSSSPRPERTRCIVLIRPVNAVPHARSRYRRVPPRMRAVWERMLVRSCRWHGWRRGRVWKCVLTVVDSREVGVRIWGERSCWHWG